MATRNAYLAYKRDTSRLLYWIIKSSNAIIQSPAASILEGDAPKVVNTTGKITVSSLVSLSRLIAQHVSDIPPAIYRLFRAVIDARTTSHAVFQQLVAKNPDPEIERSNASHKRFIDALTEAFDALGGAAWKSNEGATDAISDLGKDDLDQLLLANKFGALNLGENTAVGEEEDDDDASEDEPARDPQPTSAPLRHRQARPGKGKKGKRGKKPKKQQGPVVPETSSLDDVPLESYRIILDQDGIVTDYLVAVYALVRDWMDLRAYLQGVWHDVAYDGLNGAVAGAVSNLAVAAIQRSASAMFLDFPGHDSYETVMDTITRGNPEKAQGNFVMTMHAISPDGNTAHAVRETSVDVKEQFLIHCYRDLVDFVVDFQQTRTGKPTKRMLQELRDWDPDLNLQKATHAQRLRWRRCYTINWLYDLVNLFSSIVVQRNTMRGERHVLEKVDWSVDGPWDRHRRLFGLNEFAGAVTTLAMQKPGTDIRKRILPHHVFQLQCIVDSLTASRGWSLSALHGHVLEPPAIHFRPRRDVDLFLDREQQRTWRGFLQGVHVLRQLFERDGALHGDKERHRHRDDLLEGIQFDFVNWLGESKYMSGLTNIPPSRFSTTNANGLWEYSPFLCGVGLMEGLEIAYRTGMAIWDRIPEPISIVHLHNMLVQKGHLERPVGLYGALETIFQSAFFADGNVPTSDFANALTDLIGETGSHLASRRRASARAAAASTRDIHRILDFEANRFFKLKSNLVLYRESNWNAERIPDTDVPVASLLGMVRVAQTRHVVDPVTGVKRREETDLVGRAKAQGMNDQTLSALSSSLEERLGSPDDGSLPEALLDSLPSGYTLKRSSDFFVPREATPSAPSRSAELSGRDLLTMLRMDISRDVCGDNPLSSLNYISVASIIMMTFEMIEDELKKRRNPLYVRAYETGREWRYQKRVGLVFLALMEQEEECLSVMAEVLESGRTGFMEYIYWEDLKMGSEHWEPTARPGRDGPDPNQCLVM